LFLLLIRAATSKVATELVLPVNPAGLVEQLLPWLDPVDALVI
jgi:hypothetical protein